MWFVPPSGRALAAPLLLGLSPHCRRRRILDLSQWLTRRFPKIVDAVAQPPVRLHEFDHRI